MENVSNNRFILPAALEPFKPGPLPAEGEGTKFPTQSGNPFSALFRPPDPMAQQSLEAAQFGKNPLEKAIFGQAGSVQVPLFGQLVSANSKALPNRLSQEEKFESQQGDKEEGEVKSATGNASARSSLTVKSFQPILYQNFHLLPIEAVRSEQP